MKKFLIGATAVLSALALSGAGGAVAQDVGYTFPPGLTAGSACTATSAPPQLTYNVAFSGPFKGNTRITLSFTRNGQPFGTPIQVRAFSGTVAFPTSGNGNDAGYIADGWTQDNDLWFPGPQIRMSAVVVDRGDGNAEYESARSVPVTYDRSDCVGSQTPTTTVPPPVTTTPIQLIPPTPTLPQPPPEDQPLPRTGLSTFETGMRMGALLLIGGLGFVIVARRRRFSTPTTTATA